MNNNYKKALFINYGGLGDEILFLPTLRAFKDKYPDCKITLALEKRSKAVKDLVNYIDETIFVDIKACGIKKYINILKFIVLTWFKGFNIAVSSGKSPFVAIILFLTGIKERIGYSSKTSFLLTGKVELDENQYAAKMYHDLLKPLKISDYSNPEISIEGEFEYSDFIALHPGVSKMSIQKGILKCPDENFWHGLIKELLAKNKKVLLLGGYDDKDLIEKILADKEISTHKNFINYFNKTKNIKDLALIMKKANSVICVDSAPLHIAIALGAKVYAIFAPTNEKKLVPLRENIEIIKNDLSCRPCLWHKRNVNCENSDCLKIDYHKITDKIN